VFGAFEAQLNHFVDVKIRGNQVIARIYAREMPAPFLSVLIDDCIANGRDYNAGGARYNNRFIQAVGIGTITDSLAAIGQVVYEDGLLALPDLLSAMEADYEGHEALRQRLLHRTPKYGNDDDAADDIMRLVFDAAFEAIDGRPTAIGGAHRLEMLPTTSHVYFGSVTGATADGRRSGLPVSEGISPVQGADRKGPTAVFRSGGTLLNMKFTPTLIEGDEGIERMRHLVRGYFDMHGHHVQFNVVDADTLREAQADPDAHRDLIVRVAGYSDYFCDLSEALQEEIIERTEHAAF
jgi:formate C-acetyltransferase